MRLDTVNLDPHRSKIVNSMPTLTDRVYVLYAEWEMARDQGREFDFDQVTSPTERDQLRDLINQLEVSTCPGGVPLPDAPAAPPETKRYAFLKFLARGGMGEVWCGVDKSLGRTVALKVLRQKWGVTEDEFQDEALRVARLSHPGIVAVYDLERLADGRLFFAMKLVEGQTFEQWMTDHPVRPSNPSDAMRVFRQICQTIAYAHAQQPPLVHRDLKPQNVMVGQFGDVYVMDWGIAKTVSRGDVLPEADRSADPPPGALNQDTRQLTSTGVAKGTMAYMAPDQFLGDTSRIGPASDVFGLGGILFRMLTGSPPFATSAQRDDLATIPARLQASEASPGLIAIALKCLDPDPALRFQDAGQVLASLAQHDAEQDRRAREAEIADARRETERAERRRRRVWQAILGTLALSLLCVALVLASQQRTRRTALAQQAELALAESRQMLTSAQAKPLDAIGFRDAAAAAEQGAERARAAQHATLVSDSEVLLAVIHRELNDVPRNVQLITDLAECRLPAEPQRADTHFTPTPGDPRVVEKRYLRAFERRGIKFDLQNSVEKCIAQLQILPGPIQREVAAALDGFWLELVLLGDHSDAQLAKIQTLIRLAGQLDSTPQMQYLLEKPVMQLLNQPVPPEEVAGLVQHAESLDVSREPVTLIHRIYLVLRVLGKGESAETLLLRAVNARPQDVLLLTTAALLHERLDPPEWERAVEYRRALRSLRPETGLGLAYDLMHLGRYQEAILIARSQFQHDPDSAETHFAIGICLSHDPRQASKERSAYEAALRLRPDFPAARQALETLDNSGKSQP